MMFLVLDKDGCLNIFDSVDAAQHHLEAIDIENNEHEFCDEWASRMPVSCFLLAACSAETGSGSFSVVLRTQVCRYRLLIARGTFGRRALRLRHLMMPVRIFHAHRPNQPMKPMGPCRGNFSVLASDPARGLSLSR
jgi:hypothetical protein